MEVRKQDVSWTGRSFIASGGNDVNTDAFSSVSSKPLTRPEPLVCNGCLRCGGCGVAVLRQVFFILFPMTAREVHAERMRRAVEFSRRSFDSNFRIPCWRKVDNHDGD
jgi:hypothetical protein